jgi:hypothetical protein
VGEEQKRASCTATCRRCAWLIVRRDLFGETIKKTYLGNKTYLGRIYRGPSPSERPPRAHYPLLWRWCLCVVGPPVSASSSTEHREDCRALARDCRGVRLAEFFLPPPRTSLAWSIRPTAMWTPPARELLHPVNRNGIAAVAWLLRPDPSRDLRWAIKAKAAAPPRQTTHSRPSRPPSSHPPAPTSVAQAP